jgi:deoxyribose-phosphate aldolase
MSNLPTLAYVASLIDHAILKPQMSREEVDAQLDIAIEYNLFSVCVRPSDILYAKNYLRHTDTKVGTVIGFPHGSSTTQAKVAETVEAIKIEGAEEIDMVINIGKLKSGLYDEVEQDIREVVEAANSNGVEIVKVIFETAYLTRDEIIKACELTENAGAAFVKTSTGFAHEGATLPNVKLMRENTSSPTQVKASGGVTSLDIVLEMLDAGVTRFGTSASKVILDELQARWTGKEFHTKYEGNY